MPSHHYTPDNSTVHSEMARKTDVSSLYYGEPRKFDPTFRGPICNRSCTDLFCCVIFVIVIFGYIALGTVAWLQGDPRKVIYPTDSYGQFCGQKGTPNANKSTLFYFNILKCANPAVLINLQCPTTQMCVSKCPDKFSTYTDVQLQYQITAAPWDYYRQFCKPGFNNPTKPVAQVLRDEDCPSMIVPSRPFLQRCFPDFITLNGTLTVAKRTHFKDALDTARSVTELRDAANGITGLVDAKEVGMKIVEDYAASWNWILIGLVIALVVSLIFILLLRFTAGLLLWFTIIAVILVIAYGIWHCYLEFSLLRQQPGAAVTIVDIGFQTDVMVYLQLSQTWLIFLIALGTIEASILIILIFLRRRVRVAIALLREGSKAVSYIMSTLFYPIITFLLLAVCSSYFAVTSVFLASSGDAIYKVMAAEPNCIYANKTCNPDTFNKTNVSKACPGAQCTFAFYGGETPYHRYLFILQLSNLLIFLWLVNFTIALGQCTLAGAFASYYWARRKPQDIPPCPLFSSFSRAIRYHTGSLAFGALILAVVQMARIILEYLDSKLKGANNMAARFVLCCLKCCFWCLERFVKFMNRNAYIMIAIYGKGFCMSARDAFCLLMRNVVRVAVLDRVTDFLLFLGKVLIAGSVGVIAFFFFTHKMPIFQEEVPTLHYYWVPLLTVIFGSYLIAHGFFSVYAMCVDTLFLCFCEDLERNDGSSEKPFLMSAGLHSILRKTDHH
ncbi:choline transporter-like protein 5-A [Salvelinus fontinalis]|uniref:choline transporter-like protein 5-A n=1 Tax=Salvelinus fontinalis TaxID=8038 RepID=UPI002486BF67|nr:choline transporter-like protein 5-A [Salvelinus fontinalis]